MRAPEHGRTTDEIMLTTTRFDIQPGALLATAPAAATVEQLNAALAPHGLCLPIFPLRPGLSLAELAAANAGGRRRLRHGPIGRYLRAALVGDGLRVGGPTLKRATGYGLNRAIAGGGVDLGPIREITVNLRPLPPARACARIRCPDPAAAFALAQALIVANLELSALAFAASTLLAEIEGPPAILERQLAEVLRLAHGAGALADPVGESAWHVWEELAASHHAPGALTLDVTLPRRALADLNQQAQGVAARYGIALHSWGDAGVGALHLRATDLQGAPLAGTAAAEAAQALAVIGQLARAAGGDVSLEEGAGGKNLGSLQNLPGLPPAPRAPDLTAALRAVVGERYLLTRPEDMSCYELDASIAQARGAPLAVALPASTEEAAALVKLAGDHGVPVVTRGAGSGLAGGSTPTPGALVIGLNRLDTIRLDRAQMVAHVGAGVITSDLQRAAELEGLFYPPDPSSQTASTIGGNIACNAGGPRCLKYGVTADYVLALTAVLADGRVVRWGDGLAGQGPTNGLAQLLTGSEGTLAVITEATLRLIPQPRARRTTLAIFDSLDAACSTVEQIMAAGLIPAGLEIMDDTTIAAVEGYLKLGLPADAEALLLMLADGEPEAVDADAARLAELARAGGARRVQVAQSAADEANLWKGRRSIAPALARIRPARLGEDISVPVTQIASCVRQIKQVSAEFGLPIVVFGHAGDGNLHPNILFDPADPAEAAKLWPTAEAIFAVALGVGGTLSGEHGIGTLKRPFMAQALGAELIAAQRRIKDRFDPAGLLNPGKVLP